MPEHTLHVQRTIKKPGFLEHSEGKTREMVGRRRPEQGGPADCAMLWISLQVAGRKSAGEF